jgi:hypothetical protein
LKTLVPDAMVKALDDMAKARCEAAAGECDEGEPPAKKARGVAEFRGRGTGRGRCRGRRTESA